jgi:hypothetical protein
VIDMTYPPVLQVCASPDIHEAEKPNRHRPHTRFYVQRIHVTPRYRYVYRYVLKGMWKGVCTGMCVPKKHVVRQVGVV